MATTYEEFLAILDGPPIRPIKPSTPIVQPPVQRKGPKGGKQVFTRFPGNKRRHLAMPGIQPEQATAVLEPFCGTGAFSLHLLRTKTVEQAFWGEQDRSLIAVYKIWQSGDYQPIYDGIEQWKLKFRQDSESAWIALKQDFEAGCPVASLVLRKLTFGGVVRFGSKNGKLNVRPVKDCLQSIQKWHYRFPKIQPVSISIGYEAAIESCKQSSPESLVSWVDPPYYLPRAEFGRMVPCYPNHKPHDDSTLEMAIDALAKTAEIPTCKHLIYSNYQSEQHDQKVAEIFKKQGFDAVSLVDIGRLDGMHRGTGNPRVLASEGIWIAQRSDLLNNRQLDLFNFGLEVAA